MKLSRTGGTAWSPWKAIILGSIVAATQGLGVAACAPAAPDPTDSSESLEGSTVGTGTGEPGVDVLGSFAFAFILRTEVSESEQESMVGRYFVDATFAPTAYFGRWIPPDDARAWVEREEPLAYGIREELERLGLTICGLDPERGLPCDALETGEKSLFFGLGEPEQFSESRWGFDFGFGVLASSGLSIGGAHMVIQSHAQGWSLETATVTHMEH